MGTLTQLPAGSDVPLSDDRYVTFTGHCVCGCTNTFRGIIGTPSGDQPTFWTHCEVRGCERPLRMVRNNDP